MLVGGGNAPDLNQASAAKPPPSLRQSADPPPIRHQSAAPAAEGRNAPQKVENAVIGCQPQLLRV